MQHAEHEKRRAFLKSSVFGIIAASLPNILISKNIIGWDDPEQSLHKVHDRYPAIKLELASEVVGYAHFNLDKLKKIVDPRPELAKAVWDFGFGDWESAIAAGSHVGRTDIVRYLIDKGASPSIFTFAMLGNLNVVKTLIDAQPGIQKHLGPHGISLLQHAKTGREENGYTQSSQQLIDYLEKLGDADGTQYLPIEDTEKSSYIGDYLFNKETQEGFTVKLNMRKMLSLGRKGKAGGALYKIAENRFTYNGAPSVTVIFNWEAGKVVSLTLTEPGLSLIAVKH